MQSCHSASQCTIESPSVSPVPGSQPVSAIRAEDVEMNPRPACPVPSTSSSLSVANSISEWEQRAAQDSRQGHLSPSTPTRVQSPATPSSSRARRRALCWPREEEDSSSSPPMFALDQIERIYRVSELATDSSMRCRVETGVTDQALTCCAHLFSPPQLGSYQFHDR